MMDKSLQELNSKLKTLKFRMGESEDIIAKQDKEAMDRQRLSVSAISTMVNTIKETIEENMFAQGKSEEDVQKWAEESERILAMADQCVRRITQGINNLDLAAREAITLQEEKRKLEFEKILTDQKLRQERDAVKEKRKLDFEHQQKLKEVQPQVSTQPGPTTVKMPK